MPNATAYPPFDPIDLGKRLRKKRDRETARNPQQPPQPFVTFLLGAGFSRSAGIPVASEIVAELEKEIAEDGLFRKSLESGRKDISRYAQLMEALGTPKERALHIRDYVNRARDPHTNVLRINWAHLLLASLVQHKFIRRILTTNFDPLVVEALALLGQPIRTFDLNTTGHYDADIFEDGTVVYLHGQMHSLMLANADTETQKIQPHYRSVLQEAIRDSFLIVVGYSGDCDPVLEALNGLLTFPQGLWWSQYESSEPGQGVRKLFQHHANSAHLARGDGADLFMRKLVHKGMGLSLPDIVTQAFASLEQSLERIGPALPPIESQPSAPEPDPVASAIALVRAAYKESATTRSLNNGVTKFPVAPDSTTTALQDLQIQVRLDEATLAGNWERFDQLAKGIAPNPDTPLSRAVGDGWFSRAVDSNLNSSWELFHKQITETIRFGVSEKYLAWVPVLEGNALSDQAGSKGATPESDQLFTDAGVKYAEALRIKPDMHEAFFNWGNALSVQARSKGATPEADKLFADAGSKFAEALRIKPDMHEAFNNWGNALLAQAKSKGATPEADRLFAEAGAKFAEAVRVKPDKHEAFSNWGNALSEQAKCKGATPEAGRLFADAGAKFTEAVRIKPNKYEAFFNWGSALFAQAKSKTATSEADRLFADASAKFAEALRIKPDMHEAFFSWGNALYAQAKSKGATPEADQLFADAGAKFAEAFRIKPDKHEAFFNWGCTHALQGHTTKAVEKLSSWKALCPKPTKAAIDSDTDFDLIRAAPEFLAFRATLQD